MLKFWKFGPKMVKKAHFSKKCIFLKIMQVRISGTEMMLGSWNLVLWYLYMVSKKGRNRFLNFWFFLEIWLVCPKFRTFCQFRPQFRTYFQKKQNFKNLFLPFLDTIYRYSWSKFQLPSIISQPEIRTWVILRKTCFCEKWVFLTIFGPHFQNFNISTHETYWNM